MLSNAYFLAKFRFDTAENEPAKNLQNCVKICVKGRQRELPSAVGRGPLFSQSRLGISARTETCSRGMTPSAIVCQSSVANKDFSELELRTSPNFTELERNPNFTELERNSNFTELHFPPISGISVN